VKSIFCLAAASIFLVIDTLPARAQRNAHEPIPVAMRRVPADTNAVCWHTIHVSPRPNQPSIHFYDKLNPIWWLQNADAPVPPDWYLPDDKNRKAKWHLRNPFHNFNFYVIGVADKKIVRSGYYPKLNSNPNGGWNFAVTRRVAVLLPFISYNRSWITFYLGWREHGAFGAKLNFHHAPKAQKPVTK
jgi:hypothetical protein